MEEQVTLLASRENKTYLKIKTGAIEDDEKNTTKNVAKVIHSIGAILSVGDLSIVAYEFSRTKRKRPSKNLKPYQLLLRLAHRNFRKGGQWEYYSDVKEYLNKNVWVALN